ncbi:MAG: Ig-like domain-containing protein [Patescibacteria group bacterium]
MSLPFFGILISVQPVTALSLPILQASEVKQPTEPTPDEPTSDQSELTTPELTQGPPRSTTAVHLNSAGAKLAWTPTGVGEVQDTYEVTLTNINEVDDRGKLTSEALVSATALAPPEYSIEGMADGTYYWQVRSCTNAAPCGDWSEVWRLAVDSVAPGVPIAAVTSGQHDRTVTMTGAAESGLKVVAIVDESVCETSAAADGMWSCTFASEFGYGTYQASVTVHDEAGNASGEALVPFKVKELFVAPLITKEELPPVLQVAVVDETLENKVFKQPISVADSATPEVLSAVNEGSATFTPLSTEGGLVHSSDSGWQLLGMPWFLWAGLGGLVSAGWLASSGRLTRSLGV